MRPLRCAFLISSLLVGSCTCGGGEESARPPAMDRSPVAIPEGWVYEVALGGDATLARLRDALPEGSARALFPSRVIDVVDAQLGLTAELRDAVAEGSPLRCIALAGDETPRRACALRVDPASLAARPGGPHGAQSVDAGSRAGALADDVLVVADDRETLALALRWLAFTAMAEDAPRGLVARVSEDVPARILRPQLDAWIAEQAREARAQVEREREAHADAPALGEPEAVIAWLEAAAAERVALLPDVGTSVIELDVDDGGVALSVRSEVREGSPLARRIAGAGPAAVRGLRELPEGTVLAWASTEDAEARRQAAAALRERLVAIAGERIGEPDRARLAGAIDAWAGARGDASVAALGLGPHGAWAALASVPAREVPLEPLRDALAIDWADALALAFGCERFDPAGEGDALALCPGVHVARGVSGDASALVLAQGTLEDARGSASALASRIAETHAGLGSSPDVERVLGASDPEGTFFSAVLVPSALPALVGRLAPSLRERAESLGAARGAPWLVRARRDGNAAVLELRASRDALADLLALIEGLSGT